jgi:hypothetical protein
MKAMLSLLLLHALPLAAFAAAPVVTVTGGKTDQTNVVCSVALPTGEARDVTALKLPDGKLIPAQVVQPALLEPQDKTRDLVFVLPKLKAGETVTLTPSTSGSSKTGPVFAFADEKGKHTDLLLGSKPVLRYINAPHDPGNHFLTFKPFHHVYDPAEGKTLLTNGAYASAKEGLYPHHRGLFFGFNKISYGDKKTADIWHGTDNVFSQHDQMLGTEAGPVLGRHRAAIGWHGKDGAAFAREYRELTAYNMPGGTLIDWSTILSTLGGEVKLDGDPQHAGFHFRAAQEVAAKVQAEEAQAKKDKRPAAPAETYFLRPDGKGEPGDTRNWDPNRAKTPKGADLRTINMPWDAMSFVLDGKRYTVLRIDHPDNPKPSRGSERDYGRFGDYFEYTLKPDHPLRLRYRVWVQEGDMTVEQCNALAEAFVHPPAVKVQGN